MCLKLHYLLRRNKIGEVARTTVPVAKAARHFDNNCENTREREREREREGGGGPTHCILLN